MIELILDDHRRFEALLRQLRDSSADRDAVRQAFSTLHVAHAEAEEKHVYPSLRKERAIDDHEKQHGEEEHAEGNEALLAVLELKGTDTQAFDDAVEELSAPGQPPSRRGRADHPQPGAHRGVRGGSAHQLGDAFVTERNAQIDADCGRIENVRQIVAEPSPTDLLDESRTKK